PHPPPFHPPFPTRRSSDLRNWPCASRSHDTTWPACSCRKKIGVPSLSEPSSGVLSMKKRPGAFAAIGGRDFMKAEHREHVAKVRSEEHTSELQSPYDLVCR